MPRKKPNTITLPNDYLDEAVKAAKNLTWSPEGVTGESDAVPEDYFASMDEPVQKRRMSFSLPEELCQRVRKTVKQIPGLNQSNFAERALEAELDRCEVKPQATKNGSKKRAKTTGGRKKTSSRSRSR